MNKNLTVFGIKFLGNELNSKCYIDNPASSWNEPYINKQDKDTFKETSMMNNFLMEVSASLGIKFVDTQSLICNKKDFCPNYVDGNIISYDGSHLTKHGVKILGTSL